MILRARRIPSRAGRIPITAAVLVGLVAAACSTAESPIPTASGTVGGTLRVVLVEAGAEPEPGLAYYDPGVYFLYSPLWRCCLVRTLLSYNGRAIEQGGAELRPDLASEMPKVSADGLTWTFHLKPDIAYAPPLDDRIIEARDIITALEYAWRFGDPLPVPIVGVRPYAEGSVDTIAGLEAPDATTLVVHLEEPMGDLGAYMATSPTAPIPAEALAGRADSVYAGFLAASGPYMYEGAAERDITDPDADPIWASADEGPVVLVRNPSWERASDELRGAYVDRIEVRVVATPEDAAALVDEGEADVMGEPAPLDVVSRYVADPELQDRVFTQGAPRVQYIALNLAAPPMDDVHVRRAVNFALDRAEIAATMQEERGIGLVVANHAFPDILLNNLLVGYAPFGTTTNGGDLRAAQDEMRLSRYDSDGDGSCDDAACDALAVFVNDTPRTDDVISRSLAEIGINLVPSDADPFDPSAHVAATVGIGWGVDLPRPTDFGGILRGGGLSGEEANLSLLGATPEDLAAWGYAVERVPNLDARIEDCEEATGSEGFECWAAIDQLVMERTVAWAPLVFPINGWITSDRVASFAADVFSVGPSLDQVQLREAP